MRDRDLTGPWAGFSFRRGDLVTPENRVFSPQDLMCLSFTATLAREWKFMMDDASKAPGRKKPPRVRAANVIYLRDEIHRRAQEAKARSQEDVSEVRRANTGSPKDAKA
jgi:hypothetical protein